jgi:hypothetical protein
VRGWLSLTLIYALAVGVSVGAVFTLMSIADWFLG